MKILAIEKEIPGTGAQQFQNHLQAEARQVWQLYQSGSVREIYFRADRPEAVLVLECEDTAQAQQVLDTLPLVKAGLIRFELIPLGPYPGYERLFSENPA